MLFVESGVGHVERIDLLGTDRVRDSEVGCCDGGK